MRLLLFNLATDETDPALGFAVAWIRALARRCDSIRVVTMRAGPARLPANVEVRSVGKERGYTEPRRALVFYQQVARALREVKPHVCFAHMTPLFAALAAPLLKPARVPMVLWYAHPKSTSTLRLAHRVVTRVVTSLETTYPNRDAKVEVVGQGIDTDVFAPGTSGCDDAEDLVLCVGRLSPAKRLDTLVRALPPLLSAGSGRPVRVRFLGGPAVPTDHGFVRQTKALARELGVDGLIEWAPPVGVSALVDEYRAASLHVNLTPTGFGDKTALEAMACAVPCVAANEGFRHTLGRYADDLLFPEGDAEGLAARIHEVLSWPTDARRAAGEYLRTRVVELHGLERLADRLVEVFSATLRTTPVAQPDRLGR